MLGFIETLRRDTRVSMSEVEEAWTVRIPKSELVIEVTIPRDVLERFVTTADSDGREVWRDRVDYYATTEKTREQLAADMERDLRWFVEQAAGQSHLPKSLRPDKARGKGRYKRLMSPPLGKMPTVIVRRGTTPFYWSGGEAGGEAAPPLIKWISSNSIFEIGPVVLKISKNWLTAVRSTSGPKSDIGMSTKCQLPSRTNP